MQQIDRAKAVVAGRPSVTQRGSRGVSLLEMMIVLAVAMVAGGIAFMNIQPALRQARVNNAFNTTLMALRRAREAAIAERRIYFVTLTAPRTVTITQGATGTVILTATLPQDISFTTLAGIPAAGPDGFGTGANAIDFDIGVAGGQGNPIYFYPDGSAHDVNGNTNNGVLYIARPGELMSSRAISLFGASGRLKGWRLYTNAGGTKYWGQQ
jgi:Tfp pilus assembly protein FimT